MTFITDDHKELVLEVRTATKKIRCQNRNFSIFVQNIFPFLSVLFSFGLRILNFFQKRITKGEQWGACWRKKERKRERGRERKRERERERDRERERESYVYVRVRIDLSNGRGIVRSRYVSIVVYIYIYIYEHVYIYIYTHIYTHINTYIC